MPTSPDPASTLRLIRRLLLWILVVSMPGTVVELLLLGHFDDWKQLIPLVLLSLALLALVWHGAARTVRSLRALQVVMLLFVASGGLGVLLHYRGNVEFELEMYPSTAGRELFRKAMTGATPVLAPGTMVVLGMIGLAYTVAHPRLRVPSDASFSGGVK